MRGITGLKRKVYNHQRISKEIKFIFRIKEFKTRHINRELLNPEPVEEYIENKEKLRLLSASSSIALRTTNYTNNTASKFFQPPNIPIDKVNETKFNPSREIKSSYSYFRPKYETNCMLVEKHFIDAKQKEAAEKRHQEEVKEYVNEWGMAKSFYKEEVEKKQDMKSLINYLENHKPKDKRKLYQEQVEEGSGEEAPITINTAGNAVTLTSQSEKKEALPTEYNEAEELLNKLSVGNNVIDHKNEKIKTEMKKKRKSTC
jgi:hypothetical protein